jgi:hypothetical protein
MFDHTARVERYSHGSTVLSTVVASWVERPLMIEIFFLDCFICQSEFTVCLSLVMRNDWC